MPGRRVTKFPSKHKGDEAVSDPFCLTGQEKWLLEKSRPAAGPTVYNSQQRAQSQPVLPRITSMARFWSMMCFNVKTYHNLLQKHTDNCCL